jgi:hypothetical protein
VTYAAPRHQEHNGICESNWKNIRKLAFAFMNDAQVDLSFFPMALEHAWKVHATLPHTALTMESGDTQSPHLVYFGKPARVADFKVLFCPVIMNYDDMLVRNPNNYETNKRPRLERLNRKNNSQKWPARYACRSIPTLQDIYDMVPYDWQNISHKRLHLRSEILHLHTATTNSPVTSK